MGSKGFKKSDPVAKENKIMGDEYVAKLDSASPEELRQMMTEATAQRIQQLELKKRDPDLLAARERMATASAPYREAVKRLEVCARRIKRAMEGKGMDTGVDEEPQKKELSESDKDKLGGTKPESPNSPEQRAQRAAATLAEKSGGSIVVTSKVDGTKVAETQVSHGFGGKLKPAN